jgi:hypothetical protein
MRCNPKQDAPEASLSLGPQRCSGGLYVKDPISVSDLDFPCDGPGA